MPDRYAVIGNPVAHSRSPAIHARFASQTGERIEYGALLAPLDGFGQAVETFRRQGGKGANVTLPFKEQACALAGDLTARARAAGAVNTLLFSGTRIGGDNTDGCGLINDLTANLGIELAGRRVLLIGAGGAARGVLLPLLEARPAVLWVVNRSVDKARILSERGAADGGLASRDTVLRASGFAELEDSGFDLVINATSAGLNDAALPLPAAVYAGGALAYEMVYGRDTAFMRQARDYGAARVVDGLGMLVEQAAESFYLWRGIRPQTAPVLAALRGG